MKYAKPPLTCEQQADLLLSRGMRGDRELIVSRLQVVNYYRLSGYWYGFRGPDDQFRPGTSFESVWRRYAFDRRLRLVVMDAIERIEVAIRTYLALELSHQHKDPFAYATDKTALPRLSEDVREKFLQNLKHETANSRERFVEHFFSKYGDQHAQLPIWMATEVLTFGELLTLYRGVDYEVQKRIAHRFDVQDRVLGSWLLTLNTVRNICAHHGRLWNRELGTFPLIPSKDNRWNIPVKIPNHRVFAVLSLCRYCLSIIAPQSGWSQRLESLLAEFSSIPLRDMEFPENWKSSLIWK